MQYWTKSLSFLKPIQRTESTEPTQPIKSAEDWAAEGRKYSNKNDSKSAIVCYSNAARLWSERAREIRRKIEIQNENKTIQQSPQL